ncbi:hypothetical protein [Streptomyces sp. NPDC014733]|uniref:hypothetical protein n=1 Tax=Streptomyces sp. NPDC014733 TaxID=3364885 RepID=UPI0036FB18AE
MTTPTPGPTPTPPATPDPFAPSPTAVRVFAGIGLLLLGVAYVAFAVVVLRQAYTGDGAAGPLTGAAQWSLALSAVTGLSALCLPSAAMSDTARRRTVAAQYALAFAGPVLAAIDFS